MELLEFLQLMLVIEGIVNMHVRGCKDLRIKVSHLKQYLLKNTETHRCCEHFILKNDLRAANKCGSTRRSLDYIYGLCARVWAWLKFCENSVPLQLWDCISKLCRITSWKAEPVTYSSVMGSISACSLCSPLIVHRCSARLCVPHLVAAGSHRRHIRCSDFITGRKRGME